jgi:hypothetical protein
MKIACKDQMMGANCPHTPITIGAAVPAGALPRRLQPPVFPETELALPCRKKEAMKRAAIEILMNYRWFPWLTKDTKIR